jgi:hypothetical protein
MKRKRKGDVASWDGVANTLKNHEIF